MDAGRALTCPREELCAAFPALLEDAYAGHKVPPIVRRAAALATGAPDARPARVLALALCVAAGRGSLPEREATMAAMEQVFQDPNACILDVLTKAADKERGEVS